MIINTSNLEEAKKLIRESSKSKEKIIVQAQNVEFNRRILEYGKFDILLSPEMSESKRSLRSLDSGLDYVMAKSASKNHISIGIDLKQIKSLEKKRKSIIFSKIKQNLEICRKEGTKIVVINATNKINAFSLLMDLGASTKQAKEASE